MLLEIVDVQDADDALLVYAIVERSTGSWDPQDDYTFPEESVTRLSRSVFDDLPQADSPESELRSFLFAVSPTWTPVQ